MDEISGMKRVAMTREQSWTFALLPEILLTVGALVVLLVNAWRHTTPGDSRLSGYLALASLVLSDLDGLTPDAVTALA